MEIKRYFIIRVDGIDWGVTDNATKVVDCLNLLKSMGCTESRTEMNNLTTIYYLNRPIIAE